MGGVPEMEDCQNRVYFMEKRSYISSCEQKGEEKGEEKERERETYPEGQKSVPSADGLPRRLGD